MIICKSDLFFFPCWSGRFENCLCLLLHVGTFSPNSFFFHDLVCGPVCRNFGREFFVFSLTAEYFEFVGGSCNFMSGLFLSLCSCLLCRFLCLFGLTFFGFKREGLGIGGGTVSIDDSSLSSKLSLVVLSSVFLLSGIQV